MATTIRLNDQEEQDLEHIMYKHDISTKNKAIKYAICNIEKLRAENSNLSIQLMEAHSELQTIKGFIKDLEEHRHEAKNIMDILVSL
jgi:predicted RNase H-like nuclease (RuvC/YqgF family)